jgi:pimeloyl-ACP methyl ester carboxylesterase
MRIKSVTALILTVVMLASCNRMPSEPSLIQIIETSDSADVSDTVAENTGSSGMPLDYKISEPDIKQFYDLGSEITFFRDGNEIHGRLYIPEKKGPYKTIILAAPLYCPGSVVEDKAWEFCENGYAAIVFDFRNNFTDDPDNAPRCMGDFVYEQVIDLLAVMDSLKYIPDVDPDNVFLWGHSMGGLDAAYAGALRHERLKGIILVEPSLQHPGKWKFENGSKLTDDMYGLFEKCDIPVLIIRGTGNRGGMGDMEHFYDKAVESYPKGKIEVIEGADHYMQGNYGEQMVKLSLEFMDSCI